MKFTDVKHKMLAWFLDESNSQFGFKITDVGKQEQAKSLDTRRENDTYDMVLKICVTWPA